MEVSKFKYEAIWKILKDYYFDINFINAKDLICVICNGILINAYQNICGCRYCFKCIENYSSIERKYCPGPIDNCREHFINMADDVHIDHAANKKLSVLVMKCPVDLCQHHTELKNMDDHIKNHREDCPYSEIGCTQLRNRVESISEHLTHEKVSHSHMVVKVLDGLKKELAEVRLSIMANEERQEVELVKKEIEDLKKRIGVIEQDDSNDQLMDLLRESQDQIKLFEEDSARDELLQEQLGHDLRKIESRMRAVEDKVDRNRTADKNEIERVMDEVRLLLKEWRRHQSDGDDWKKVADELRSVQKKVSSFEEDWTKKLCQCRKNQDRTSDEADSTRKDVKKLQSQLDATCSVLKKRSNSVTEQLKTLDTDIDVLRKKRREDKSRICDITDRLVRLEKCRDDRTDVDSHKVEELEGRIGGLVEELNAVKLDVAKLKLMAEDQMRSLLGNRSIGLIASQKKRSYAPFEWRVEEFRDKMQKARDASDEYLTSPWFKAVEYRMSFKLYPNGDELCRGTHLSLFLFIEKRDQHHRSDHVTHRVVISLADQTGGIDNFIKEYVYCSLIKKEKRLCSDGSLTGDLGASDFIELDVLQASDKYIVNDSIIVKCSLYF